MTLARDAELDRLKAAQDRAFQRKQDAHQVQQRAWEKRSSAREVMNRAYEEKQRAYAEQDQSWQYLQQVRSANGPQIDSLNARQEDAYRNMKAAYDAASAAYERRDGTAKDRAAEGRRYKEQSQGFVAERRRLVAEIRSAGDRHHATKPAFQRANAEFKAARATFDAAKAEHERAQAEFKTAKAAFAQAQAAFRSRLDKVKAEGKRRSQDRQALARQAGVPAQYLDNVWVSEDPNGNTNIYFGGVGKPNGPNHGHYVLSREGKVTYKRDPFDSHGAQNFQRDEATERRMARVAMDAWARRQTTPREVQYQDGGYTVKVKSGHSRRYDAITTDVIIAERTGSDEHYHLVIDDRGNTLFSEWRKNH